MKEAKPLSPQRETFAQLVASGKSQAEAHREAYPRSRNWKPDAVHQSASRLMTDVKVAARVAELRAPIIAKVGITLEQHLADLQRLRDLAEADGKYSAAVSAELARGKASGLHVERVQHEGGIQIQVVTGIAR